MAGFLAIGLAVYEIRYNRYKKSRLMISRERLKYLGTLLVITAIAALFYHYVLSELAQAYSAGAYPFIINLIANGGTGNQIVPTVLPRLENPLQGAMQVYGIYASGLQLYLLYALMLVLFGFGIAAIAVPEPTFGLLIPWLSGVFLFAYPGFIVPESQYFSYVDGPAVCAAILGAYLLLNKKGNRMILKLINITNNPAQLLTVSMIGFSIMLSIAAPAAYLLVATPLSQYHLININTFKELVLFQINASQQIAYNQLDWAINQIPQNAILATNNFITPHVANREFLTDFEGYTKGFPQPQYLLIDMNDNIIPHVCALDNCTLIDNFLNSGNYTLYQQNGTAKIYRLRSLST